MRNVSLQKFDVRCLFIPETYRTEWAGRSSDGDGDVGVDVEVGVGVGVGVGVCRDSILRLKVISSGTSWSLSELMEDNRPCKGN